MVYSQPMSTGPIPLTQTARELRCVDIDDLSIAPLITKVGVMGTRDGLNLSCLIERCHW